MSQENTHKLMGFYVEGLILGVNTLYWLFCFFKLFPMVGKGLIPSINTLIELLAAHMHFGSIRDLRPMLCYLLIITQVTRKIVHTMNVM